MSDPFPGALREETSQYGDSRGMPIVGCSGQMRSFWMCAHVATSLPVELQQRVVFPFLVVKT